MCMWENRPAIPLWQEAGPPLDVGLKLHVQTHMVVLALRNLHGLDHASQKSTARGNNSSRMAECTNEGLQIPLRGNSFFPPLKYHGSDAS